MRVLFVPFGSEGDVNPLIWLAEGLSARGHEPVFLLTPHYGRLADQRGFAWFPVGTEDDFARFVRNPKLWDRRQGPTHVIRAMIHTLPDYRRGFELAGCSFDLVVTSSFALAGSALAEARRIPRLTLHMQPVCLRSQHEIPLFLEELRWLQRAPRWVKRLFFRFVDAALWSTAQKGLNAFRGELGLAPLRRFYEEAVNGADGVAALFPPWFGAPQPDWAPHVRQFGFPVNLNSRPLSPELDACLAGGAPPVIWTHGSANFDIRHFQTRALSTCEQLGLRCLLISLDRPSISLPPWAFHAAHARFEDVFPRCRAVVHHGGIGTTAKCIAAAVPQLIIPRSHDQPDNADRIARLGLGRPLAYRDLDTPRLGHALTQLIADQETAARCRQFSQRLCAHDPLPDLCDWAVSISEKAANLTDRPRR